MTRARKTVEWVKTVAIALLSASALLLAWRTELYSGFFNAIPLFGSVAELVRGSTVAQESGGADIKEAARPLSIVITGGDGARYGIKYDTDARNAVYDRTSSILGEALGSASTLGEISEEEWREALSGPGVFFEYISPVRLSILGGWLGARLPGAVDDVLLRRVCVAFGEDKSRIYCQDVTRGLFFGADTASAAGKMQELEIYSGNGAKFAFETGISAAENSPYMLIMPGSDHPDIGSAAAGNAYELLDMTVAALGHEKFTTYYNRGLLVCVGTQFNINVDIGGQVLYRRTDGLPQYDDERELDANAAIEQARLIVEETIGTTCGGAEVFFEALEYGTGDSCSVFFGYYIAGGRVFLHEDVHAARVSILSGTVAEVELIFRNFTFTGETTRLMPERQALAAAGSEFILSYSDAGQEVLRPSWVRS